MRDCCEGEGEEEKRQSPSLMNCIFWQLAQERREEHLKSLALKRVSASANFLLAQMCQRLNVIFAPLVQWHIVARNMCV